MLVGVRLGSGPGAPDRRGPSAGSREAMPERLRKMLQRPVSPQEQLGVRPPLEFIYAEVEEQ